MGTEEGNQLYWIFSTSLKTVSESECRIRVGSRETDITYA